MFNKRLGGGFKYFFCSPLFGEDSHFHEYFSDGLKPPTRRCFRCLLLFGEGLCFTIFTSQIFCDMYRRYGGIGFVYISFSSLSRLFPCVQHPVFMALPTAKVLPWFPLFTQGRGRSMGNPMGSGDRKEQ